VWVFISLGVWDSNGIKNLAIAGMNFTHEKFLTWILHQLVWAGNKA
jgi:hypothetical protein